MVRKSFKKLGFSLVEALISMAILSIFFAATAKIITTKPKKERVQTSHGSFYCCSNSCTFKPPSGVSFFNIYAKQGYIDYYSVYEPNITEELSIDTRYDLGLKKDSFSYVFNENNKINRDDFENYLKLTNPEEKDNILACNNVIYISW